jgi:hypothetical protein
MERKDSFPHQVSINLRKPVQVEQLPAFPLSFFSSSVIVPFHIYKDKSGKAAACNKELYKHQDMGLSCIEMSTSKRFKNLPKNRI